MRLVSKFLLLAVVFAALTNPAARQDLSEIGSQAISLASDLAAGEGVFADVNASIEAMLTENAAPADAAPADAPLAAPQTAGEAVADAAPVRRRLLPRTPPKSTSYRFTARNADGTPARWNPCQTIHYVVNLNEAPAGALADVHRAIAELSRRTGLKFAFDGVTGAPLRDGRLDEVTASGTGENAPLMIGWATPATSDVFARTVEGATGVADIAYISTDRGKVIDAAIVVLDAVQAQEWKPGFGKGFHRGSVLLHELGHAVGLAHVDDESQLMYETVGGEVSAFAAGDRAGLATLGRGGCL